MPRRWLARAATAAVIVAGSATMTAQASTGTSFTLAGGTLSIAEPASANLGSATLSAAGTTVTGHLGTTTITDNRGSVAGWTVAVATTNFTDGATPTPHTVAANKLKAFIATGDGPTVTSGVAVPTTPYPSAATALTLSTAPQTFLTATTTGSNVVTYNPTFSVTVDSTAIAGTYTGTVTQTVS